MALHARWHQAFAQAFVLLMGGLVATATSGCDPGVVGDPRAEPRSDKYGTGSRIAELMAPRADLPWLEPGDPDSADCPGVPRDVDVDVTGIAITAEDLFDETGGGAVGNLWGQDSTSGAAPLPHSGMTFFAPGFSPPDLRVVPGDVLDLFGVLLEFEGPASSKFGFCRTLPEMTGAMSFRFEGGEVAPARPALADLATYEGMRPWLGMLVTFENVVVTGPPFLAGSGRYAIPILAEDAVPEGEDGPTITNELMDLESVLGVDTPVGTVIAELTGVLTYFYSPHVAPRSAADVVVTR